jgi:hypothetical protein
MARLDDPEAGLALSRKAERRTRNSMEKIGWLIYRTNHPVLRSMFMAPSDRFRMRAGLVTILAGNLQPHWRYSAPLLAFNARSMGCRSPIDWASGCKHRSVLTLWQSE